jgi:hypothetical protein
MADRATVKARKDAKGDDLRRAQSDLPASRPAPADVTDVEARRAAIQAAVNSIERPMGLTDKQWEFVKAGARLVVRRVNAIAAQPGEGSAA